MKFSMLGVAALLAMTMACGKPAESAPAAAPTAEPAPTAKPAGAMKAPGEAQVGDTTKCPVSGEEFVVDATSPKVEHGGKTYYFCCGGCKKKFESNPDSFVNKT